MARVLERWCDDASSEAGEETHGSGHRAGGPLQQHAGKALRQVPQERRHATCSVCSATDPGGLEERDIDFRVPGLSHAVVKEAENFRVQELVKKIESHPHREALQADLQQNNVYNPFSNNSKAMIREMGDVELFELCETIPKVQCSQCLL